ncbi:MAG: DUF1579 domain-containing protein [Planctomycetes bacterium]|nr:DUF1579 domain-containing protein [Planctomycetota bacterium]
MDETCESPLPQPTPEHEWLMTHVGEWIVDCAFYMDPSAPPLRVEARDTVEAFGRFFTIGRFRADMFGAPFEGIGTVGYDPRAEQFVSTWIDTMSPHLFHLTGHLGPDGRTLEMRGRAPEPNSGEPTDWRTVEQHVSPDERVFEMFMTLPQTGQEMKMFTHVYRRA